MCDMKKGKSVTSFNGDNIFRHLYKSRKRSADCLHKFHEMKTAFETNLGSAFWNDGC